MVRIHQMVFFATCLVLLVLASHSLAEDTTNGTGADEPYKLLRSTLIGSSGTDYLRTVRIDGNGDLVLLGYARDPLYIDSSLRPDLDFLTTRDPFVMKVSRDLTRIIWSQVLKGSFDDVPMDMALGPDGDVFVVGTTSSVDFIVTERAYQGYHGGGVYDVFVSRLSASDGSFIYSTYLGGGAQDLGTGVAVDDRGRAVVVGTTRSEDFPSTLYKSYSDPSRDMVWTFMSTLSESGRLIYTSLLGADCWTGIETPARNSLVRVVLDEGGCPIVAGSAFSNRLTTDMSSFQPYNAGGGDLFVCKLTGDGKELVFATYVGGEDTECLAGLDLDADGNIVLSGWTHSKDFPTTFDSYNRSLQGSSDGFVLKMTPDGGWLVWSTFLGLGDEHYNRDVEVGPDGAIYLVGTNLTWKSEWGNSYFERYPEIVKMDPSCTRREFIVEIPESRFTEVLGIAVDGTGTFVVVGSTYDYRFPTTPGTIRDRSPTSYDGFVLEVSDDNTEPTADAGGEYTLPCPGPVQLDGTASSDDHLIANWTWMVRRGDRDLVLSGPNPWVTFLEPGVFSVDLTVLDWSGNGAVDGTVVRVGDPILPVASAGDDMVVNSGTLVTFDGSRSSDNVGLDRHVWSIHLNGGTVTLEGATVQYLFVQPGMYEVDLTVSDLYMNSASDSLLVQVLDTRAPVADAGGPLSVGQYSTVTLDGSRSRDDVGIVSAEWRCVEGWAFYSLDGLVATHRFVLAGLHEVTLHVWDAAGNHASSSTTIRVNDTTSPMVDAGPDVVVGAGDPVFFNGSRTYDNTRIHNWEWSFLYDGGTMVFDGPGPHSFRFRRTGVYYIVLTATDSAGNVGWDHFRVQVVDRTPPTADAGQDIDVFVGEGVDLVGTGSWDDERIVDYRWYVGVDDRSIMMRGAVQDLVIEWPGTHYVLLVVRDDAGNTDWDWMVITATPREDVPATQTSRHVLVSVILLASIIITSIGISLRYRSTGGS